MSSLSPYVLGQIQKLAPLRDRRPHRLYLVERQQFGPLQVASAGLAPSVMTMPTPPARARAKAARTKILRTRTLPLELHLTTEITPLQPQRNPRLGVMQKFAGLPPTRFDRRSLRAALCPPQALAPSQPPDLDRPKSNATSSACLRTLPPINLPGGPQGRQRDETLKAELQPAQAAFEPGDQAARDVFAPRWRFFFRRAFCSPLRPTCRWRRPNRARG